MAFDSVGDAFHDFGKHWFNNPNDREAIDDFLDIVTLLTEELHARRTQIEHYGAELEQLHREHDVHRALERLRHLRLHLDGWLASLKVLTGSFPSSFHEPGEFFTFCTHLEEEFKRRHEAGVALTNQQVLRHIAYGQHLVARLHARMDHALRELKTLHDDLQRLHHYPRHQQYFEEIFKCMLRVYYLLVDDSRGALHLPDPATAGHKKTG